MKKISDHLAVQLQATKASQNGSSRTNMPKNSRTPDPSNLYTNINAELLLGEAGAVTLVDQFALLWQNQWLKGKSEDEIPVLLEAWIHELSQLTPAAAERACIFWKYTGYPPDLAAFLSASHRKDFEYLYRLAQDTAHQIAPDYSTLPALVYAAGKQFGWPYLRVTSWDSKDTSDRWKEIVVMLEKYDDLGLLPPPPQRPSGLLNRPKSVMPAEVTIFFQNFRTRDSRNDIK